MLNFYNLSRNELIKLIKTSNKTPDGYYWFPRFLELAFGKGEQDDSPYYYNREYFKYKMYFNKDEMNAFLAKEKEEEFDIENMYRKSMMFCDVNRELFTLGIDDFVPTQKYRLYELIDCFEYKYSF